MSPKPQNGHVPAPGVPATSLQSEHLSGSVHFDEKVRDAEGGEDAPLQSTVHPRQETEQFIPPDGGWGWLVCFAAFWTNGVVFGIINTFGIMYVALLDEFDPEGTKDIAFKTCE